MKVIDGVLLPILLTFHLKFCQMYWLMENKIPAIFVSQPLGNQIFFVKLLDFDFV